MAKAELKLTSLGFWRGYSSANRAGVYSELVAVAPIFKAMMNEKLVIILEDHYFHPLSTEIIIFNYSLK